MVIDVRLARQEHSPPPIAKWTPGVVYGRHCFSFRIQVKHTHTIWPYVNKTIIKISFTPHFLYFPFSFFMSAPFYGCGGIIQFSVVLNRCSATRGIVGKRLKLKHQVSQAPDIESRPASKQGRICHQEKVVAGARLCWGCGRRGGRNHGQRIAWR